MEFRFICNVFLLNSPKKDAFSQKKNASKRVLGPFEASVKQFITLG
jgi:hypothetical protein